MRSILKPIITKDSYSDSLIKMITESLTYIIFRPILAILLPEKKQKLRLNSVEDIRNALRSGRIFWQNGYFYGDFNATVGKALRGMGAKWVGRSKAYKLGLQDIPLDMRVDLKIGSGMNKSKSDAIFKHLEEADKVRVDIGAGEDANAILDTLNFEVVKTFKVLPETISLPVDISESMRKKLTEDYITNLNYYINGWKEEQIERLRYKTQENAEYGYRADRLAKIVQSEYGVTKKKAKFIARQETSLFVSKYRQERYTEAGIQQYIWSTSGDERVRDEHKSLNGKTFWWNDPPIVDKDTGRKANPGEDFNCRCIALPILNLRG